MMMEYLAGHPLTVHKVAQFPAMTDRAASVISAVLR